MDQSSSDDDLLEDYENDEHKAEYDRQIALAKQDGLKARLERAEKQRKEQLEIDAKNAAQQKPKFGVGKQK